MVLVSYIDILDYTGNDRQSLIHGEELFNEEKVKKVFVEKKSTDYYDYYSVTAVCFHKELVDSERNSDVFIKLYKEGGNKLESKCSCTSQTIGKCEHVVATLIYLHRHDTFVVFKSNEVELPLVQSKAHPEEFISEKKLENATKRNHESHPQSRRLRQTRSSTNHSNVLNECDEPSITTKRNSVIISGTVPMKNEDLTCEDSNVSDPNWDKENEDGEDEDEWRISSDDDWEPTPIKRSTRGSGKNYKKGKSFNNTEERTDGGNIKDKATQDKHIMGQIVLSEDGLFHCPLCDVTSLCPEDVKEHLKSIHLLKKQIFSCQKCNCSFKLLKTFKAHRTACGAYDQCNSVEEEVSDYVKDDPGLQDEPLSPEPPSEPLRCLQCEVITDSRQQLRDHYLVAHERSSVLVCERCGDYRLPRDHICPSQLEFRCGMCRGAELGTPRTFKAGRDYWNHLIRSSRLHRHGQHRARCGWPGCAERFQGELELLDHVRLHLPEHMSLMCPVCRMVLRNTDAKLAHMEKHDAALGVFECIACRAAFPDKAALREHWESHRERRPHRCDACGWRFASQASLRSHVARFHEGGPFCCAKCPQKFEDRADVRIHFAAAHGKARCPLPGCGFRCASQSALDRHKSRAHSLPKSEPPEDDCRQCKHCGLALEEPGTAGAHRHCALQLKEASARARAARLRGIVCVDCDKSFKSQRDLEEHRRMHTGEKPFICAECGMTFKRAQNLEYHMKGAHKNERNFLCPEPECGKRYISNADMKRHLRYSHQGGKKWHLCPECGHKLPSLYNLKLHAQSRHSGERPHKCSLCGQGFVASSDLKKHVLYKHHKEHPFACEHCNKRYQRKRDLHLHIQRHHSAALFRCRECGKDFESYASMMQHSRYHTTEEPYQCAKCGRRFPHKMNLSRHLCAPNIKKSFRCHTCGLSFTTGGSLKSHRRRLHAGEISAPPGSGEVPQVPQERQEQQPQQHDVQLDEQHDVQLDEQHDVQLDEQLGEQLDEHPPAGLPVSLPVLDQAYEDYDKDKLWRGDPGPTWAMEASPQPAPEVILTGDSAYHELSAVEPAESHPHLLVDPTTPPGVVDMSPPMLLMKEPPGPPQLPPAQSQPQPALLSLLIKTEEQHAVYQQPPPLPPLHPLQPLVDSGPVSLSMTHSHCHPPPLKLISMPPPPPPPPPLMSSQPQSVSSQGSLILGAPIQTTADGSFHLVFVPHIPTTAAICGEKQ